MSPALRGVGGTTSPDPPPMTDFPLWATFSKSLRPHLLREAHGAKGTTRALTSGRAGAASTPEQDSVLLTNGQRLCREGLSTTRREEHTLRRTHCTAHFSTITSLLQILAKSHLLRWET